jgi:hypothetical protein
MSEHEWLVHSTDINAFQHMEMNKGANGDPVQQKYIDKSLGVAASNDF